MRSKWAHMCLRFGYSMYEENCVCVCDNYGCNFNQEVLVLCERFLLIDMDKEG